MNTRWDKAVTLTSNTKCLVKCYVLNARVFTRGRRERGKKCIVRFQKNTPNYETFDSSCRRVVIIFDGTWRRIPKKNLSTQRPVSWNEKLTDSFARGVYRESKMFTINESVYFRRSPYLFKNIPPTISCNFLDDANSNTCHIESPPKKHACY